MRDRAMQGQGERGPHESGFGRQKRRGEEAANIQKISSIQLYGIQRANQCLQELATRLNLANRVEFELSPVNRDFESLLEVEG